MSFVVPFIMAVLVFLPFVIMDGGFFTYYGDYDAQQIPFGETAVKGIQNGETAWTWYTDIGINFIASYSGHMGSPFFWITTLFPPEAYKFFMAPTMSLKIALASLFAFLYIRRFVKKPVSALIGGLLYAFSGYSIYNIVFFLFHEAICFFPLLLLTLEEAVVNKRKGFFALAVALNAFAHLFSFIAEVVFLVIYFIVRCATSSEFRINVGSFFSLAFESIVGVMLSCILTLPTIIQILDSPESSSIIGGNDFMFFENSQYYGNIIKSMFFVTDVAGKNVLFPRIKHNWNSAALYIPLFAMSGVFTFFISVKKHWVKILLSVCLLFAFIPGLNAMFTAFNNMYYARWFFMPALIMALATVYAFENAEHIQWKQGFTANVAVYVFVVLMILFHPVNINGQIDHADGSVETVNKIYPYFMTTRCNDVFAYAGFTGLFIIVMYLLLKSREKLSEEKFTKAVVASVVASSIILSYGGILSGRALSERDSRMIDYIDDEVTIPDENTRVEIYTPYFSNNINMCFDLYSARSFNSVVPHSIYSIYEFLQDKERTEASYQGEWFIALRSLLGVKYLILHEDVLVGLEDKTNIEEAIVLAERYIDGFEFLEKQGKYYILENKYAIPMGYSFDNYILYKDARGKRTEADLTYQEIVDQGDDTVSVVDRIAVEAVAITEEQAEKYSDILTQIDPATIEDEMWTMDRLALAAQARRDAGVTKFEFRKNSFYAETDYAEDELVVFSVPYDGGWSAFIDGNPTEIDKVNGGFIALRVPAGKHSIDFNYTVPCFDIGIILTCSGIILITGWFILWYVVLKKGVRKICSSETVSAHKKYIDSIVGEDSEK